MKVKSTKVISVRISLNATDIQSITCGKGVKCELDLSDFVTYSGSIDDEISIDIHWDDPDEMV